MISDKQRDAFTSKMRVASEFGLSLAEVQGLQLWQYGLLCEELNGRSDRSPAGGNSRGTPVMR